MQSRARARALAESPWGSSSAGPPFEDRAGRLDLIVGNLDHLAIGSDPGGLVVGSFEGPLDAVAVGNELGGRLHHDRPADRELEMLCGLQVPLQPWCGYLE